MFYLFYKYNKKMAEEIRERKDEIVFETVTGNTLKNRVKMTSVISAIILLLSIIIGVSVDEGTANQISEILYDILVTFGL